MITGTSATTGQTTGSGTSQATSAATTVNKNMFLQLLVAQIKNQDPLNPSDGVQYLTQLAQFTELEQTMAMRADIEAIRTKWAPTTGQTTDSGNTNKTTTDGTPSGN